MQEYDTDGNGQISFPEFLSMMWRLQSGPSEREIVGQMFTVSMRGVTRTGSTRNAPCVCSPQIFDDNLDGLISLEELREAFRRAAGATGKEVPTDDVLRAMIAEVDSDGDDCLTLEDFKFLAKEVDAAVKASK